MPKKLNDHGRAQVCDFLLAHHKHGMQILMSEESLGYWYADVNDRLALGLSPTLHVPAGYAKNGLALDFTLSTDGVEDVQA